MIVATLTNNPTGPAAKIVDADQAITREMFAAGWVQIRRLDSGKLQPVGSGLATIHAAVRLLGEA